MSLSSDANTNIFAALYAISIFLMFVIIPFLHFFNEESESNSQDRLYSSIKYTFVFLLLMIALLAIGSSIPTPPFDPNSIISKILHIAQTTKAQDGLNLVLAIITAAGSLNVVFYTASGIFSWPIGLLLGTSSVASRFTAMNDRETLLRSRISNLNEKARVTRLSDAEREQLTEAEDELRTLEREEAALSGYSNSWTYKLRKAIRPLQIIFGSVFGLLAIVIVVSLILVNIDRVLYGLGPKQGYVLVETHIFNPLSFVFMKLQELTFIGPMPLLIITCFLAIATISGVRNLGLWLLFTRLHRIKLRRTQPRALLFFCVTIMLAALSFNLIIYSMTSEFFTFGLQNHQTKSQNGTMTVVPCTLKSPSDDCIMTRSSVLLLRMVSQLWVFGALFYWYSWAFVTVAFVSFVAYLVRGKRQASHGVITDAEEFED